MGIDVPYRYRPGRCPVRGFTLVELLTVITDPRPWDDNPIAVGDVFWDPHGLAPRGYNEQHAPPCPSTK